MLLSNAKSQTRPASESCYISHMNHSLAHKTHEPMKLLFRLLRTRSNHGAHVLHDASAVLEIGGAGSVKLDIHPEILKLNPNRACFPKLFRANGPACANTAPPQARDRKGEPIWQRGPHRIIRSAQSASVTGGHPCGRCGAVAGRLVGPNDFLGEKWRNTKVHAAFCCGVLHAARRLRHHQAPTLLYEYRL